MENTLKPDATSALDGLHADMYRVLRNSFLTNGFEMIFGQFALWEKEFGDLKYPRLQALIQYVMARFVFKTAERIAETMKGVDEKKRSEILAAVETLRGVLLKPQAIDMQTMN